MVQMAGVLVLAAGVPAAFEESDYRAITLGYLVMRVGLVAQWSRAGLEDGLYVRNWREPAGLVSEGGLEPPRPIKGTSTSS